MNPLSTIGAAIVTLALISYSIGIKSEHNKRKIIPRVLIFITLGVILDVTACIFMILGSNNSPFTIHGYIAYSALLLMLIGLIRIWKAYKKSGIRADIPQRLHAYSSFAYIWWVVAYFTSSLIVMS
jgi:hypothetical protein